MCKTYKGVSPCIGNTCKVNSKNIMVAVTTYYNIRSKK